MAGLGSGLAQPNRMMTNQTYRHCPDQDKKQAAKQRDAGAEQRNGQKMAAWGPPSPGPWLWTGRCAAALASAALKSLEIPEVFLQ